MVCNVVYYTINQENGGYEVSTTKLVVSYLEMVVSPSVAALLCESAAQDILVL